MDIHPGEFVCATKGRDKGKWFLVVCSGDTYVYIADGKNRKISNPKKKNLKHIVSKGFKDELMALKLKQNNMPTNKEIRCLLKGFYGNTSEQNC